MNYYLKATRRPMKRNDEGGIDLDPLELRALSYFMLSRIANDIGDGEGIVEWEDVPELSQGAWEALLDQFKLTANTLMLTAHNLGSDIDPRFIWEQVS